MWVSKYHKLIPQKKKGEIRQSVKHPHISLFIPFFLGVESGDQLSCTLPIMLGLFFPQRFPLKLWVKINPGLSCFCQLFYYVTRNLTNMKTWHQNWGHCCDKPCHVIYRLLKLILGSILTNFGLCVREVLKCFQKSLLTTLVGTFKDQIAEKNSDNGGLALGLSGTRILL